MAATFAVIGEAIGAAGAAETAGAVAVDAAAGIGAAGIDAAAAATIGSATVGGGAAVAGAAGAAVGGSLLTQMGTAAAGAIAGQLTGKLLTPKVDAPKIPDPVTMPDPMAQQMQAKKSLVEQLASRGRASTILTSPGQAGGGKLGG